MSDTPQRKLVLTGFMGTGKTTLGKLVAEKVGVPFVDLDDVIVQKVGLSIPEIFEKYGEAGFRAWESAVCAEVAADPRVMVVATGGGALISSVNRQAFQNATIVCLISRPEIIYERIKSNQDRPLLAIDSPQERIIQLLNQRKIVYSQFPLQVDTSDQPIDLLATGVLSFWSYDYRWREHESLVRTPEGGYPIQIGKGMFSTEMHFRNFRKMLFSYRLQEVRTVVVTDSNVFPLYGELLVKSLNITNSLGASITVIPAGEEYKNLDTVKFLYDEFARLGLDRTGVVIALGGGVVGDTVGFAAATYMRGVKFVQIPTTLLAMVDSSVGGKVGVDIPQGKNLVGAFKQPDLVIIDPEVLKTLPPEEMSAGMAEVIKHGLLANPALLDEDMPLVEKIKAAVQVKIDVVQRDPYEQGERAHLNLGHTFAHAIEQVSGYAWRHGFAVGVGLIGAAMLSQKLGYLDGDDVGFIEHKVKSAGLPIRYQDLSPDALWEAMKLDKKWRGGRSHFVILKGIGNPAVVSDVPRETVLEILEMLRDG